MSKSNTKDFVSENALTPLLNKNKFRSGPWGDSPPQSPDLVSRITNQNLTDSPEDSVSFKVENKFLSSKPIIPSLKIFPKSFELATRDGRTSPLVLESLYESPSVDEPNPSPNPYLLIDRSSSRKASPDATNRQLSFGRQGRQNSNIQPGEVTNKSRVSHKRNATEDFMISPRTPALFRQDTDEVTLEEPEYE